MGRRNRRSWEEGEEDYGLERAEKNWLKRRHDTKRQKTEDKGDKKIIDDETPDTDTSSPKNDTRSSSAEKVDKIERMKLKKQRQKERRREKKAAQSALAAEMQQSRKTEQSLRDKQKKDAREKKIRIEERQSQQKYTSVAMGVKYQDLIIGKGPVVQHRKKVRVSYTLRAKSHTTGKILDSSANFGFRLGKGEVIKGWDIGLQDMRVGGTRRLVVPRSAGYGFNKDVGAGRGADLYFQIELLHVAP